MLSKIFVWDLGSEKNLFCIPDPGVKKALDSRSGSHIQKNIFRKEVTVLTISKVCKFVNSYVGQY